MQELNQYLRWCDDRYTNLPHCNCGEGCTNQNYCKGLQLDCYACIKRVHDYHNHSVHYNCVKMLYYYVLKHGYRFGSEVYYLFHALRRVIDKWDQVYIASIGCGPCTELFGALSKWRKLGKPDTAFHFRGYDLEPMWRDLMSFVPTIFTGPDVLISYSDAITGLMGLDEPLNIVILNYMLSDMLKFDEDSFDTFLSAFCDLIQNKRPRFILVNDIYLKVSLAATASLVQALKDKEFSLKHFDRQFAAFNSFIGQHGLIVDREPMCTMDATIKDKYNPFRYINSIQTIIQIDDFKR